MRVADDQLQARVLVVDREPADARLAESILAAAGCARIATTSDPRAAMALQREGAFGLVLLGVSIAHVDDCEVIAELAAQRPNPPRILAVTPDSEVSRRALQCGARDVVGKAVLAAELPARVRNMLETSCNANRRLQYLSDRVLAVQEEERRMLSGELHDDIGQSLLALRIGMHRLAQNSVQGKPRLLAECVDIVGAVQDKIRELSVRLHPPQLMQRGLAGALRALVSRQRATTGLDIRCMLAGPGRGELAPAVEIACYRICQEAINNATRHARARVIHVRAQRERGGFCLSVQDDGAGFDSDARRDAAGASGSLGLISMEERARLAGGELELRTAPGAGTVVIARFARSRALASAARS
jgi:signal transduction histidine kinase